MPHVIVAGTSNPLGFLNTGPAPYAVTVRVQIWTDTNGDGKGDAWHYMNPGVNTGTLNHPTAWGSEVQLANRWLESGEPGFLWVVKGTETVKGGSTLADDWDPGTGAMFASTTQAAANAMRNLEGGPHAFDHYDAAFIGLGENDAIDPAKAAAFGDRLPALNTAARAAWKVTKLVEYRITDGPGAPADNLLVRQAQWQADQADPDLVTYKTIGMPMLADKVHYAQGGHLALGDGNYDGWLF
jgi:hypothetical protein